MPSTLYLTADETRLFGKNVSAALRKSWQDSVREEALDTYETEEQLQTRMQSVSYGQFPQVKALAEKAAAQKSLDGLSLQDIPPQAMPVLLHSIGACGVSALIELSFQDPALIDDNALEGIAGLSRARHQMLIANALMFA